MHRRANVVLWALALLVAALYGLSALGVGGGARPNVFASARPESKVWLIAHQGGEGMWPSNTALAFDRAAAMGADMLDTDIHMTRDGHLIALHDASVNRTTNGRGLVKKLTLAQLRRLDAAYTFSLDGGKTFPYRGKGLRVPTLSELLQAHPDMAWGIEIKQDDPPIAGKLCEVLRAHRMTNKVIVASFKDDAMQAFRKACPEVLTSMTEREVRPLVLLNLVGLGGLYHPAGASLQVPPSAGSLQVVTERFVRVAARKHLSVQVWTVNKAPEMRRLIALGVDGINTDYPDVLKGVLNERNP